MNTKEAMTTARSKSVVQGATLRGLGTAMIGAGLLGFQDGSSIEEKVLGLSMCLAGLAVYVIKDVLAQQ